VPKVDPETSSQGLLVCYAKVNGVIRGAVVHLNRRSALGLVAAPALLGSLPALLSGARAEAYPAKPIRIIVPYPAGGRMTEYRASSRNGSARNSAGRSSWTTEPARPA